MRLRSRLWLVTLQRWLARIAVSALALIGLAYFVLQVDRRTLPGIRVSGEPLARTRDPAPLLRARATRWGEQQLSLVTGPYLTTAKRSELGASLAADALAGRLLGLGRSGNPALDLWVAWGALVDGIDVTIPVRIDRVRLGRYVRAVRNVVERPPVAGITDQAGGSFGGAPGVTLDTAATSELLERTLRSGGLRLSVDLHPVPAPQAIAIGTPDGVDEKSVPVEELSRAIAPGDAARLHAAAPKDWLPSQGCEPMDPPYERFCQGPRQAPLPFGAAAALADRLDLGTLQTVRHLLNAAPRSEWVSAAGGPRAPSNTLLWPVAAGRLWRRFGYVRRPPFEHLLHRGIDVGAPKGSPLLAVNPGIVAYSDNRVRGYGNLLVLVHADASVSFSAHCRAIYVFAGERVARGQIVGEVGDTGLARGSHVHWEYHIYGQASNPDGLFAPRD